MDTDDSGLLQRIEVLGQSFDVQTELVDHETGKVRTVIFSSGRAVAHQESHLGRAPSTGAEGDTLKERLEKHHGAVIGGFVKRTLGFESWEAGPKVTAKSAAQPCDEADLGLPPLPEDPFLADSLDVRRLFGEVRRRISDTRPARPQMSQTDLPEWFNDLLSEHQPEQDPSLDRARLDEAASAFSWATAEPIFARVRIDEQVRFHLMAQKIDQWRQAGKPEKQSSALINDIEKFLKYIHEINLRAELEEFDRRLISWALRALKSRSPVGKSTLKPLQWLFGRDPEIDAMLALDEPPPADRWLTSLRQIRI